MVWVLWVVVAEMELGVWIILLKGKERSSIRQGKELVYN